MLIKDAARQAAEAALDTYLPRKFPVDPFSIAREMDIDVQFAPLDDDTSGMIISEEGKRPRILLEITDAPTRQRFTCAHEIGHYVERTNRINAPRKFAFVDRRVPRHRDAHEFYADEFAGNLLMPANEVIRMADEGVHPIAMAEHFDVSLPAMRVRLKILGKAVAA
ncbi:ImmA/IrrE family metallo-endopeptidase [Tomitella gaofuii]|uniref:ImmA/IrrE family metallo-endopeptidase n=1 Tax=Tomitella gaofuii TaxID=2760083 RepID=UPI0015FC6E51|nr:ImmA/IrrE family metallo-endopeptidase [Tomitella gaofuii]